MIPINLRDLKYVVAVAEKRHFGKAAAACFVSQPTLSGQIKKLEAALGVVLFERSNRSVELTPACERLLPELRAILEQVDQIVALASTLNDPLAGELRIGLIPTIGPYLIPRFLPTLKRNHPQMQALMSERITEHLLDDLLQHRIDVALLATPVDDEQLSTIALFDDPFWLAHPRKHALYTAEQIDASNLPYDELLLLEDGHCLAQQVADACALEDWGARRDLRASSMETLMALVASGEGCTLVPAIAVASSLISGTGVISREIEMPNTYRTVSLVYRKRFPRVAAIAALANTILARLPNTVTHYPFNAVD